MLHRHGIDSGPFVRIFRDFMGYRYWRILAIGYYRYHKATSVLGFGQLYRDTIELNQSLI